MSQLPTDDTSPIPPFIITKLQLREGWRTAVYLDSRGLATAGMGHLLTREENAKYCVGDEIPNDILQAWAQADTLKAYDAAIIQSSQLGVVTDNFIAALTSVNFQLGTDWNTVFKNTWALMLDHKWQEAAKEVEHSLWAQETPVRVKDFQTALLAMANNPQPSTTIDNENDN